MKRRELRRQAREPDDVIDLEGYWPEYTPAPSPHIQLTICGVAVSSDDHQRLKSATGWLNEPLINAGQRLLHEQFCVGGLHDMDHWVTLITLKILYKLSKLPSVIGFVCPTKDAKWVHLIIISAKWVHLQLSTKEVIAAMVNFNKNRVYPNVQQQTDGFSYGLFALANAYTLRDDKDPAKIIFDLSKMWHHSLECLPNSAFPSCMAYMLSQ